MTFAKGDAVKQRLMEKAVLNESTGCWEWTASKRQDGYGQIHYCGRARKAHRVSYELHCGPIPDGDGHHGVCVLHRCDNRLCINPDHLFIGNQSDNIADMDAKGRRVNRDSRGVNHGCVKLTEADVLAIREAEGRSLSDIAAEYGVTKQNIWQIRKRRSWPHLTDRKIADDHSLCEG